MVTYLPFHMFVTAGDVRANSRAVFSNGHLHSLALCRHWISSRGRTNNDNLLGRRVTDKIEARAANMFG